MSRPAPEEDLLAVDAISRMERREALLAPTGWPPGSDPAQRPRSGAASADAWVNYLGARCLADAEPGARRRSLTVPPWVNDLAAMVSDQDLGGPRWVDAVKLTKRALRAAARSPRFRAAISAKCSRLREDERRSGALAGAVLEDGRPVPRAAPRTERLLRWLRERDWSDCRPRLDADAPGV